MPQEPKESPNIELDRGKLPLTNKQTPKSTQTVSTQTSATLLNMAAGTDVLRKVSEQSETIVTKNISVSYTKPQSSLPSNSGSLPVPPTPEGPRFSQDGSMLTYTHPGVQNETLKRLHVFHTKGTLCDVVIRVGDIDFKAHKIVLAAASSYFSELFKDIKKVRIDRLILEGLSAHAVASMIGYFYLAQLIIDVEDVEELLDAAYYFQVSETGETQTSLYENFRMSESRCNDYTSGLYFL